MSHRHVSGRGDRRNFPGRRSGRGRDDPSRKRGAFTKLMRDKDSEVSNFHQAKRFVEGMETFDSKIELLSKLEDHRDVGMQRIRDVLSWINSSRDVEMLLIPMLRQVLNDETARPLSRVLRNKILMAIFSVPGLMDALVKNRASENIEKSSAEVLSFFLLSVAKAFVEARMSDSVLELAKALRDRGDVSDARILCSVVMADENPEERSKSEVELHTTASTACWVTDTVPPGGRHDNDHRNYRNIRVVPTVDELRCTVKSWLPLASGENAIGHSDDGIRLLDENFRLLREDAVNFMKENINEQTRPWRNARVIGLHLGGRGSSSKEVSFVVQRDARGGNNPNWKRSRALMHGTVVALCRDGVPIRLATISMREAEEKGEWLDHPGGPKFGIVFGSFSDFDQSLDEMLQNSSINETLCKMRSEGDFNDRLLETMEHLVTCDMIEASKSFFCYKPILQTLQSMESVPLMNSLAGIGNATVSRPLYLPETVRLPDDKNFCEHTCHLDAMVPAELAKRTSLDLSQAEALHHALTSRVSLIQGPPGTGKTFIGGLIAQVIRNNTDESILCACYTNHALDQFLEHMLDAKETRIARIGGRSKSERLSKYQLKELARHKAELEAGDTRRLKQVDAQLHKQRELIGECIATVKAPVKWTSPRGGVKEHLCNENPELLEYLRVPELDDGFAIIGPNRKKLKDDFLWKCWSNGDAFPDWLAPYLARVMPTDFQVFWNSPKHIRVAMAEAWRRDILRIEMDSLHALIETFNTLNLERNAILQEKDLQVLRNARVIGATTTGAAQYRELLTAKGPGVVIVEEAGEVLEAHVLTALSERTQYSEETKHLILIGDHKQLRPKLENHALTTVSGGGYNLDCSLFERLVLSGHPSVALGVQHRMRPEISDIIWMQTHPSLRDHESVCLYPDVNGVTQNVVFLDHRIPEDSEQKEKDDYGNTKTKSNLYEARLCIELVRYFLLQGYSPDSIVVLTPYLGQLIEVLKLVKSSLKEVIAYVSENDQKEIDNALDTEDSPGVSTVSSPANRNSVRCSSIDNFQGEEADLVIVSLVRSNRRGNIGFMKEEQRVNVLLSRARLGMFLVGNSETLRWSRQGGQVWNPILSMLKEEGRLVNGLPTCCQLHPDDEKIELCAPADFRAERPNGGCTRPCAFRMKCGHTCPMACHPLDRSHELAQQECCEPCGRFPPECNQNHACPKLCKDSCGPCLVNVGSVQMICGHSANSVRCHDVRSDEALNALSARCKETVLHQFEPCGHNVETTCSNARSSTPKCPSICGETAGCGHFCGNKCGTCENGHKCGNTCARSLFCGHVCDRPCHEPDPCEPCNKKCSAICVHSRCPKLCSDPCSSCIVPCDWTCEHQGSCSLVCGAPCSRLPCNERCNKILPCGHQCPTVCGEPCPDIRYCHECAPPEVKASIVDLICCESYEEHDVGSDPIVCLPCGHYYSISTLDGHLGLSEVYSRDTTSEEWTGLRSFLGANVNEKPKCCPDCRSGIHSIQRYGRLLHLIELRALQRKHMMTVDATLDALSRPGVEASIRKLTVVIKAIEKSPMQTVYEACQASDQVEVPPPPARPLIRALQLLGGAHEKLIQAASDEHYCLAVDAYQRAIDVAIATTSIRLCSLLRISLASLLLRWNEGIQSLEKEATEHLDWVVSNALPFPELVTKAQELKRAFSDAAKLSKVIAAMDVVDGYNYGGSWSSHWNQCPNGHPYFIGDCGGAMEESRCADCGERIGGSSHRLLSTNRSAADFVNNIRSG